MQDKDYAKIEARKRYNKTYFESEKGKEARKRAYKKYRESEKGRAMYRKSIKKWRANKIKTVDLTLYEYLD